MSSKRVPITLRDMGSFMFGGTTATDESGETHHGDHGYAQYFVPEAARELPLVMWHGLGQSGKTWESTPDGREGFWQIFTRRDWPVYIVDQPRRGRAGRAGANQAAEVETMDLPDDTESGVFVRFRLGDWTPPSKPAFFSTVSFDRSSASLEQFLRQQTPNTGDEPFPDRDHREFMATAMADLMRRVGPAALVTHSNGGQYGWMTAIREPELVRAVITLEAGCYAFPSDDVPDELQTEFPLLQHYMAPQLVSPGDFRALTAIPILVMLGDNIVDEPDESFGAELWRLVRLRARQFVETVNRHGGSAVIAELPELGIRGNTHFPMSDLNNVEVANVIDDFLVRHELDGNKSPHRGPTW